LARGLPADPGGRHDAGDASLLFIVKGEVFALGESVDFR
jgi:hypothetical protein